MSLECSECERDLRGGHDESCSRYPGEPPECTCSFRLQGMDDECHQYRCAVHIWQQLPVAERRELAGLPWVTQGERTVKWNKEQSEHLKRRLNEFQGPSEPVPVA